MKKEKTSYVLKIIWTAAKRDLLKSLPFVPLYSLAQVSLALLLAICAQLIFLENQHISLMDLVPGNMKIYVPFDMTVSRSFLVLFVPIFIVFIGIIKLVTGFMMNYFTEKAGHRVASSLRERLLASLLRSPGERIDTLHVENFVGGVMQDTTLLQSVICKGTINTLRDLIIVLGMIFAMVLISVKIVFFGFFVLIPFFLFVRWVVLKINSYTKESLLRQVSISSRMLQMHSGLMTIFGLRSQGTEIKNIRHSLEDNYHFMKSTLPLRSGFSPSTELLAVFVIFIAFEWRMSLISESVIETYTALFVLIGLSYRHLKNIAQILSQISEMQVVLHRITQLLLSFKERPLKHEGGLLEGHYKDFAVKIENLSFKPEKSDKEIIKNCSLEIPIGKRVVFFGESGAGKTTLLRVIAGILHPSNGLCITEKKKLIATQYPYIFRGTVQDNIRYGLTQDQEKKISEEEVQQLVLTLRLASSSKEAKELLKKHLGYMGEGLSGGEKARVALARILLVSPDLILLDEPTANLDRQSTLMFWDALKTWHASHPQRTIIAVTHHIEEVKEFDTVYLFENGIIRKK